MATTERPTVENFLPDTDRLGQPITRPVFHHFGIATTRNKEMEDWYREVLGFEVVSRPSFPLPSMTFVSNDVTHHRGSFLSPPTLKDNPDRLDYSRIQHMAWEYETIDDMLEAWQRVANLGILPVSCWCHAVSWSFYYKDPDRNTVEKTCPAWETHEEGLAYALSEAWEKNPNGIQVDPPQLIEARAKGVGLDELRERAMNSEYLPDPLPSQLSAW
jgi:catechol 2,3-dioxygenase-like lactoylglutathione lyase family enzyme